MAGKQHTYRVTVTWTGNTGAGTAGYRAYSRDHEIAAVGKPVIPGSSDPAFLGAATRYNPEEMLVASLSACHKLWYLHLAAEAGLVVTAYRDAAEGTMAETGDGNGHFTRVLLRPHVSLSAAGTAGADVALAQALHEKAHHFCFIANSVNFPVETEGTVTVD
ncbi:OsmC family protein [Azospirillum sp. B4]|uniref:OsmC family protein n=1 Tax=Azospirillum sp. B4 TaxID=95605 RepID=UPI0005C90F14|nr:OsmC family protein [Azospirillum sp. B4]